tara:strand:+ start:3106 stop:4320 length:1215 start_codon:yes stop_codon:yes gene_type:complete
MINLNPKYKPLLNSDSRYIITTGGRGSGKSFTINTMILLLTFEKGHNILFTRYTMTSAYTSIIPEFLEKIEMLGLEDQFEVNRTEITNKVTGNRIYFKGLKTGSGNQTAALKSLSGITCWVCDEAEEIPEEELFDKIDLSIRTKGVHNKVILVMNPATKEHWIYKRFFESRGIPAGANQTSKDTTYIHTSYLDNIHNLDQSFLNQIEEIKIRRPEQYRLVIMGGWREIAEGVIFTNWQLGEFRSQGLDIWGMDFGFSNDENTLVKSSIDKKNKKIYLKEYLYKTGLTTSELARIARTHAGDDLIIGDSAEPRLLHEMKHNYKINIIPTVKGAGSVSFGIALLQDYDLIIDPESTNLVKELNNYVWNDKKSETPLSNGFDHLLDSVRYSVSYQLANPNAGNYFFN